MTRPGSAYPAPAAARLALDPARRIARLDGRELVLGQRAYELLRVLASVPGRVFPAAELTAGQPHGPQLLLGAVWPGRVVEAANLRAQIRVLRRALGAGAIETVGRSGYALVAESATSDASQRTAASAPSTAIAEPVAVRQAPRPDSDMTGRDDDLAALRELMQAHRLVTLVGPGGVGKSRLARSALGQSPAGAAAAVAWADLATLPASPYDPQAVARLLIGTLPATTGSFTSAAGAASDLAQACARWPGWLVLDNAEHLAGPSGALPALIRSLLETAPGLRVLVTSQRPLQSAGETTYRLAPLPLPTTADPLHVIQANPAVRLLLARTVATDQRFALPDDEWPAAAAIVRRLDGLPLAIELAAARLPLLGVAVLGERLGGNPLQLLGSAPRPRPGRHGTLRAVVERSVGLLAPAEQQALMAISMFAAPFDIETAVALLGALGSQDGDARQCVQALVEQSLLLPQEPSATASSPLRLLAGHRAWAQEALLRRGVDGRRAVQAHYVRLVAAAADYAVRKPAASVTGFRVAYRDELQQALDLADALGDSASAAALQAGLERQLESQPVSRDSP